MKPKKPFRVLVAVPLSSAAGRKKMNGIHSFLSEGYDWDIDLIRTESEFTKKALLKCKSDEFDGMIIGFCETVEMRKLHHEILKPTVIIDNFDLELSKLNPFCVYITDDLRSIIRNALRHFIACGPFKSFGYVADKAEHAWSLAREDEFRKRLSTLGFPLHTYHFNEDLDRQMLTRWLTQLPKPAAILASYDDRAVDVLQACRASGLEVPRQIAILGIGNDEPICEAGNPRLSSIAVDFEAEGYRSARELHAMMLRNRKPTRHQIFCGVREIVVRASTPAKMNAQALILKAEAFIDRNFLKGISARDVVSHLHVSRSLADLRFRAASGTSLQEHILTKRIAFVKHLLSTTTLDMNAIARRCGYADANYLKNLFKHRTGCTMGAWRDQSRTR